MPLYVTKADRYTEVKVIKKIKNIYEPFKDMQFRIPKSSTALFDFKGYFLDVHRISVDVKALDCNPTEYPTNILSKDKWNEFIKNQPVVSHYVVYYYPSVNLIRAYDLSKCLGAYFGEVHIFHKRAKEYRTDTVVFLPVENADCEFSDI